jgi:hypothetical protein
VGDKKQQKYSYLQHSATVLLVLKLISIFTAEVYHSFLQFLPKIIRVVCSKYSHRLRKCASEKVLKDTRLSITVNRDKTKIFLYYGSARRHGDDGFKSGCKPCVFITTQLFLVRFCLNNSKERSPFWGAYGCSTKPNIPNILCFPKIHFIVRSKDLPWFEPPSSFKVVLQ